MVLVLVGLKPTLTKQVAFGAMAPAVQPAASRTWKSAGRSPSRTCSCEPVVLLLASAMFVIVSGASPVFLIVIGTHVGGSRGTGGDARERGRQAEHGRDGVRRRGP